MLIDKDVVEHIFKRKICAETKGERSTHYIYTCARKAEKKRGIPDRVQTNSLHSKLGLYSVQTRYKLG